MKNDRGGQGTKPQLCHHFMEKYLNKLEDRKSNTRSGQETRHRSSEIIDNNDVILVTSGSKYSLRKTRVFIQVWTPLN